MISINTKRLHLRNLAQNDADVMKYVPDIREGRQKTLKEL